MIPVDQWDSGEVHYDLIGCLNLLDRCDKPMKILHSIHKSLKPGTGKAIVAVVLPFEPYVEHSKIYTIELLDYFCSDLTYCERSAS